MRNKKIFFSIVTPTLNSKKFIKKTFNSIYQQKFKNFEHIVVDGYSTDGTRKILFELKKKYKFKLIIKKDKSMYQALKRGFKVCKGKYFYWLNSDDFLLDKQSLLRLYNYLNKYNNNWITGKISITNNQSNKVKTYFPLIYPQSIIKNGMANNCFWGFIQQENTVFSKQLYEKVGGINRNFKMLSNKNFT